MKKRKEIFYSAANCPRIRPRVFEEAVMMIGIVNSRSERVEIRVLCILS